MKFQSFEPAALFVWYVSNISALEEEERARLLPVKRKV